MKTKATSADAYWNPTAPAATGFEYEPAPGYKPRAEAMTRSEEKTAIQERKARQHAENHFRKDKWVAPELQLKTAEALCAYRIKRIKFPGTGEPVVLSQTDEEDCKAAGMLALTESGFFSHGLITAKARKGIRNSMEGRACLRRNCLREHVTNQCDEIAAAVLFCTEEEWIERRLTLSQRNEFRLVMNDLRTAAACDTSRKRKANFRSSRNFLLEALGHLTGRRPRCRSMNAFSQRLAELRKYIACAWTANRTHSPTPPESRLAKAILASLEANFLAD